MFDFAGIGMILFAIPVLLLAAGFVYVITHLRRVVPTNMVHIVQSSKKTTPYGRGKPAGNTYYMWPAWVPIIGVSVTQFPESNFQVTLDNYEAYDTARLPFVVDVTAFFRVDNAEVAAQRIATFDELKRQLVSVLQGSVRRILATNTLEDIMQERSSLGQQFTDEVKDQIKEWGVLPVKTIEFMDLRDSDKGQVIANIMAKEKSRIEKESRIAVATNMQDAELKEIDSRRTVAVQKQDAEQQVGLRTAEKDQIVGIAKQKSEQAVAGEAKTTTERVMEVRSVEQVRSAEIARDVALTEMRRDNEIRIANVETARKTTEVEADANKIRVVKTAEAQLEHAKLSAEGIQAEGTARAAAEQAMLMAPIQTQIELAREIGSNEGYQQYLITIEQVKANREVGIELAKGIQKADLKIIANSGDVQSGVSKLTDVFTPNGGFNLGGMLSSLAQTPEGAALVKKVTGGLAS